MRVKNSYFFALSVLIIVIITAFQFKTRVVVLREVGPTSSKEAIAYLRSLNEKKESLLLEYERLNLKILELNEVNLEKEDLEISINDEISKLKALTGLLGLTGQGIEMQITPQDNQILSAETLIDLINDLWGGGALAININQNRVSWNSYINQREGQIFINGKLVEKPFIVEAIGPTQIMESILKIPGGFEEKMMIQGIDLYLLLKERITIKAGGVQ